MTLLFCPFYSLSIVLSILFIVNCARKQEPKNHFFTSYQDGTQSAGKNTLNCWKFIYDTYHQETSLKMMIQYASMDKSEVPQKIKIVMSSYLTVDANYSNNHQSMTENNLQDTPVATSGRI